MEKIKVNLPLNISSEEISLFEPHLTYDLRPLQIKSLKNVFVTYSGLCVDDKGLVKESHHDYPEKISDFKNEANNYFQETMSNPDNLITLHDENLYLLIHHPWFVNYYHWICEGLFRIWMVREKLDDMILILPEFSHHCEFVKSSLEPFSFKKVFIIPNYKSLSISNLCMPQIKPIVDSYSYGMTNEIKQFYKGYALNEKAIDLNLGSRIYISRSKALRKKVENEKDLIPILLKYNFTILNNEDYNFWEQVSIYSNAKHLVSIHGSGLTSMLFMEDGSSILEFHKKQTNDKDWHSLAFWYLAEALNYKYYHQICTPTNVDDDYFNANFVVDLELFEKNLLLMISE